jgi:hypothetical protein
MTPTPDYSSPVTINQECPECGDTIPMHWRRCTACWHIALDEEKTRKRVTMRDPKTITCRDCGDSEEQFVGEATRRELLIAKPMTTSDQPIPQLVTTHGRWERIRDMEPMRQPEQVDVMCEECAECVTSVVGPVDHLDGKATQCPHCDTFGKIIVGDDEGSAHIRFRAYTAKEICQIGGLPENMVDVSHLPPVYLPRKQ